jgi:putative ABC transport system permease protein
MRIPLFVGRRLDERDNADSAGVIVVNRAFVKSYFGGGDVLGKRLQLMGDSQKMREIVGVVGNISHTALRDPQQPEMCSLRAVCAADYGYCCARRSHLDAALRDRVNAVDKDETLSGIRSMDDIVGDSVSRPRFSSQLLALFSALALVLAAIGLYGLMAYFVTQRRSEIGIRMALGGTREDILRLVIGHGSRLVLGGTAVGLVASLVATRVMSGRLFAVGPNDPQTFLAVGLLLVAFVLAACYIPARRATKVDPMVALRYE